MKGRNLTMGSSSAVNNSKSWAGRSLRVSTAANHRENIGEEDVDIASRTSNSGFSNTSILMSNTMGFMSQNASASSSSNISNFRTFPTKLPSSASSTHVSLQSHRSRAPFGGQDFAFMTDANGGRSALSSSLLVPLIIVSDILNVSLFALVRWWKHRQQGYLSNVQMETQLSYSLMQVPFSLQLIPRTLQSHQYPHTKLHSSLLQKDQGSSVAYGLKNHGQTCFLNSVIQALASLPPIIAYLETIALEQHIRFPNTTMKIDNYNANHNDPIQVNKNKATKEPTLTEMLLGLLSFVGATSPRFHIESSIHIDTRDVLHKVGSKHVQFNGDGVGGGHDRSYLIQQDAQEFLQALMDMIVSEAEEVIGKPNTKMNMHTSSIGDLSSMAGSQTDYEISDSQFLDDANEKYDNTPVSLDNLLDYIVHHEQKKEHRQNETEKMISRMAISPTPSTCSNGTTASNKEEKKQDEWYHDETFEEKNIETTNIDQKQRQKQDESNIYSNENLSASMKMLDSLSSTTPSPLSGWVGSLLQCSSCSHVRPIQNAPFLDIPLVPTTLIKGCTSTRRSASNTAVDRQGRPVCTLEQCLSAFSKVESVHNVECRNCARLKKMKDLEDEINILQGGIQSRLDDRQKKMKKNGSVLSTKECDDFDVDGLQSQILECQERYQYLASQDPDDCDDDMANNIIGDDGTLFRVPYTDILSQDSSVTSPLPRCVANKCLLLTRLPSILCLHVQRRFYDARLGRMLKSSSHVDFPEILDVSSHCAFGRGGSLGNKDRNGKTKNTSTSKTSKINKIEYRLMSAVEHRGNANCGHYQTYRRVGNSVNDDRWALVSDENVKYMDWEEVKKCQAYMLFYEAI